VAWLGRPPLVIPTDMEAVKCMPYFPYIVQYGIVNDSTPVAKKLKIRFFS
jgi:hypothetical protein